MTPSDLTPKLVARFHASYDVGEDGCWRWKRSLNKDGYGVFRVKRSGHERAAFAHRLAYALAGGVLVPGLVIDHLCRVRHCVNPAHLEQVTVRENIFRGETPARRNAEGETCIHGHAWTPENTKTKKCGMRVCWTCQSARSRIAKARKRGQEPRPEDCAMLAQYVSARAGGSRSPSEPLPA